MRKVHGVLAALALALTVAGCGSAGDGKDVASATKPSSSKTSATPKLSAEEMAVKFAQCLRDHGLNVKDPEPGGGIAISGGPGGPSKSDPDKAIKACQKYNAAKDMVNKPNPEGQEMALKMAKCMRAHGVDDFPDPVNGGIQLEGSIMNDPDFKAADKACQKLMGVKPGQLHQEGGQK